MNPSRCASCQAEIVWCVTDKGNRIPVDALPVADGNIRVVGSVAHVVGATIDLLDATDDGVRHISHFASCPNAVEWRRNDRRRKL